MTREIIPIILAKDFIDFKTKLAVINSLKPAPKMIQIDISDGQFTPYKNFGGAKKIKGLKMPNFEMHLMVADPTKHAKAWIKAGAKRILFHVEPFLKNPSLPLPLRKGEHSPYSPPLKKGGWGDLWKTIHFIKQQNIEVGLCLNPETPIKILAPYIKKIDCVLVLCVTPGRSGQKFQEKNLAKIRALRKKYPSLLIEVDGGVNLDNAKKIFQAGATRLSTASAILEVENPTNSYKQFLKIANKFNL